MSKKNKKYTVYNIQGQLIQEIAEKLFQILYDLEGARSAKPSKYRDALSKLETLMDLVKGAYNYDRKEMKKMQIYLAMAQKVQRTNSFQRGSRYLGKAFRKLLIILKINGVIFPRKNKGMRWKEFVERETT